MHIQNVIFFWRGSPSIGAFGLQKLILLSCTCFFWRVSLSIGAFGPADKDLSCWTTTGQVLDSWTATGQVWTGTNWDIL